MVHPASNSSGGQKDHQNQLEEVQPHIDSVKPKPTITNSSV